MKYPLHKKVVNKMFDDKSKHYFIKCLLELANLSTKIWFFNISQELENRKKFY